MTTRAPLLAMLSALAVLGLPSCGDSPRRGAEQTSRPTPRFPDRQEKDKPQSELLGNEIPAGQLDAVVRAHLQGLGFMEQYEYRKAVDAFHEVHERAPNWIPGSINLALALLNDSGSRAESRKTAGSDDGGSPSFDEALGLLDGVLARDPANLNAHYCRGLILEFLGQTRTADAHQDFLFVAEHDPSDGHAWYKVGATLTAPGNPSQPAGPRQADRLIELYSKALDRNPYLVAALYKLQQAYGWARRRDKQTELLARWRRLNPKTNAAGPGETAEAFYGESGQYARVVNPFPVPTGPSAVGPPPRFDQPAAIKIALPDGDRWVKAEDFQGPRAVIGRARARFGATVASFDADGDGRTDLFLASAVTGPKGVRDALLVNRGDGSFDDVSRAWGLPDDRATLCAAAADFDADRRIDLFVAGPDGYRLLRNIDGTRFEDVADKAGLGKAGALGVSARWLDLDQDGDLDLFVVNQTDQDHHDKAFSDVAVPAVLNAAYRNVGKPAPVSGRPEDNWAPLAVSPPDLRARAGLSIGFEPWPDADALVGPPANFAAVAALDVDNDRDLDLIVADDHAAPRIILNDRLGAFHAVPMTGSLLAGKDARPTFGVNGLLVLDLDKDGRTDLLAVGGSGRVVALRNTTDPSQSPRVVSWERWPIDANGWRSAVAADVDLDTWPDLVGLPGGSRTPLLEWARNDGRRLNRLELSAATIDSARLSGFALADVAGDPLSDLILVTDGAPPEVARNLGNGEHWLALDLGGRWKTSFDHMRTNPQALGTRVTLEGQGLLVAYEHTTPSTGLAQSVGPVVLGLGKSPAVELVRLRWPDGTMQCELNQKADVVLKLAETNRKTGSCPVLFTWNGERFVCLGDFLGGGGLGYLDAPGVYNRPDRDESLAITADQLRPVGGVFRLAATEPMDEVAYLDRLQLVVVDRPPGVSSTPDERFAPEGPRPSGDMIAWTTRIEPRSATDLEGRDVAEALRAWDRATVDGFRRLDGWVGYAEEHGIVLDFGDRLARFGPDAPLVLVLAGWVEYPYSQTNFAAATAGVALRAPAVERRNAEGAWTVVEPHAGYPAGLPRLTTLDLTGKLTGPSCVLRLRTNMECYWDQALIVPRDRAAEGKLRQTVVPVTRAALGHRGYTREVSPDGRLPLLYDYDHVDPAPLALMAGRLTRYGDVAPLLREDDDQFCLLGPGDEVRLEFDATAVPPLPDGWTRAYVLKAVGYCKDADPFTATSDRVDPLPWRSMPEFPFPAAVRRPADPSYLRYLSEYQTRPAGVR